MIIKSKINSIIETVILLFMPLSIYSLYNQKISYGDILLLFVLIVSIFYLLNNRVSSKDLISTPFFFYFLLVIINSIFQIIINPNQFIDGLFSLLRYLLFLFFILIIPKYFINKESFFKKYQIMSFVFALYSLLQVLFYYAFHIFLPVSIPHLPTMTDFSFLYNANRYSSGLISFRPYSCFLEPGYFSSFVSYLLIHLLVFKNNKNKFDLLCIFVISISMLISGSTGIFSLLVAFLFKLIKERKKILKNVLLILFIIIPFSFAFASSQYGSNLINKIFVFDNNSISLGYSTTNRVNNYEKIFNNDDFISSFFGKGVWIESDYLPSFGRSLVSFGIPGTIIVFLILLYLYNSLNKEGKCYCILFFMSLFVSNSLFSISVVLIFSLMIIHQKRFTVDLKRK